MVGQTVLPSRSVQSRETPVCCADNKHKQERPIFPRVVESEFHVLVSRVCFKQTEQIPGFSISFLIMGHVLWVLQSHTGATHYKIKGTLPILFWKTPTHAKMRCVAPSPLGARHPQRTASSDTLRITECLMCIQGLARNFQHHVWIF